MSWRRLDPATLAAAETLLRRREETCLAACSRFIGGAIDRDRSRIDLDAAGQAQALLLFAGSVLYPLLADGLEDSNYPRTLSRLLPVKKRGVRSIQGLARDVAWATAALSARGYPLPERRDYQLTVLPAAPLAGALAAGPPDLRIRWVSGGDPQTVARVLPLQEAYEREEVLPAQAVFNAAACRFALEKTLGSQLLCTAILDERVVAKANTNARGFTRDQIGGVYVLPAYRGQGIATRLTAELARQIGAEGKQAVLFVKKTNLAALKAYVKIGFTIRDEYRICYY